MSDLVSSLRPATHASPAFQRLLNTRLLECLAVFAGAFAVFVALYSELRIDDTWRFTPSVARGEFDWDASHLLMQPATVVWHLLLGFGGDALTSQKTINSFSAALALAVFHLLLIALGKPRAHRVTLTLIAMTSTHILVLATSGHMKMTTAPWLAIALYQSVLWEVERRAGRAAPDRRLWISGAALGVGTAFLLSTIIVVPFLAVAAAHVAGGGRPLRPESVRCAVSVALPACALGGGLLVMGYLIAAPGEASIPGFFEFLFAKDEQWHKPISSHVVALAQTGLSIAYDFAWLERLGPILRGVVAGDIAAPADYLGFVLADALIAAATLSILGLAYAAGLRGLVRDRAPVAATFAFLIGCLVFAYFWNFHEAEFFFPITMPSLLLVSAVSVRPWWRFVVIGWAVVLIANNVVDKAVPKALYPLARYERELQARYDGHDLLIHFRTWPGRRYMHQFALPGIPRLQPDQELIDGVAVADFLRTTEARITATLEHGGKVVVFRMLDERDWDAPWSVLPGLGLSKADLHAFFYGRFAVEPLGEIAGIKAWAIKPKPRYGG